MPEKPRDIIPRLKITNMNPMQYERTSKRMATLAKEYYENLQSLDVGNESHEEWEAQINHILHAISENQILQDPMFSQMNWVINPSQVEKAPELSKNGLVTGMDGCPYKLWKALNAMHKSNTKLRKPSFDVIKTLTLIFQDIQTCRTHRDTDFALGWICPI